ncbi:MAG TPA: LysR family transcriptional regulator [Burkholderiaceae bacterium]|nr:LysR family transcriptional regulator [Burkholderiaceae bacterium]
MDTLTSMRVFARVAERGSFAAAARELRISTAAVTKHVSVLERRVGTRLLDRTTRSVGLTEAGRVYYEHCLEALQAVEDAEAAVGALAGAPRGTLAVTAPIDFGNLCLAPLVAAFLATAPDVSLKLQLTNRVVDLIEEGLDIAIRIARTLDGRLVARPLASSRLLVWASPAYLEKHGAPRTPADLEAHPFVMFSEPTSFDELRFERDDDVTVVKCHGRFVSNSAEAVRTLARAGAGLALLPTFNLGDDMARGALVPLLTEWRLGTLTISAVYPHRRLLAPKVRAFVEFLVAHYGGDPERDPWWQPTALRVPLPASSSRARAATKRRKS